MNDLFDMPFNIVHELYRIVFIKIDLQKKQAEEEKLKKQEEEKKAQAEREEALRSGDPDFVAKFKPYTPQTPPQQEEQAAPVQGESLAMQLINNDIQDTLGGVFS